jgi:hypothetical protein
MEGNARRFLYALQALVILVATAGLVACSGGGSTSNAVSADDFAALTARVDTLEAYRARNAAFVSTLGNSYSHFYYCDVPTHKDTAMCPPAQSHIKPPTLPAPK